MKKKLQIGILGLGKFGMKVGRVLSELGHDVMGVDIKEEMVREAQHVLSRVYQMDATNKEALEQIRIKDMDYVVVSMGDIAASIMSAMYLKEMGVEKVYAKAMHRDHEKLLHRIGVSEVIIPEYMAANHVANSIAMPGFVEYLPFDKSMALKEFTVSEWSGKTLRQIDVTNTYSLQIIAVKKAGFNHYKFIPKANDVLEKGDCFVAIGDMNDLLAIKP